MPISMKQKRNSNYYFLRCLEKQQQLLLLASFDLCADDEQEN